MLVQARNKFNSLLKGSLARPGITTRYAFAFSASILSVQHLHSRHTGQGFARLKSFSKPYPVFLALLNSVGNIMV
jgi:hypothetical protein